MKNFLFALICASVIAFSACSNKEKPVDQANEFNDTIEVPGDTVAEKAKEMLDFKFFYTLANLPSPMDLINSIYQNNVPFNKDLLNPTKHSSDYATGFKKAVNYGVYGVDMAYAAFYGQNQDLVDYYQTSKKMAEKLNVQETFDKFTESFRENADNKDSLVKIIDRAYYETDSYLRSNHRLEVASHVLAGSIIEAQYLSIELMKNTDQTPTNKSLFEKIYNQKLYLDNLISLFSDLKKYPSSAALLTQLKDIKAVYDTVKSVEDLNREKMNMLSAAVAPVRNDLIK
jgi:hypothetical protein